MSEITYTQKLQHAINDCRKLTEPGRAKRQIILNEYANEYYKHTLDVTKKPLNMVFRGISILVPLLAAKNPKAMTRARIFSLKPFAETLRLTMNHTIDEINFIRTLREIILNSLTYFGIAKSGISPGGPRVEDAYGYLHDAGQYYCDSVDPDDYVWDVVANIREEMDFEGNRYQLPMEYIKDSGEFQNYDKLSARYEGYGESEKRPRDISKENIRSFEISELRPYAEVYDIWVPERGTVLTIPIDGQGDKPLRESEYQGPESGPYDMLAYNYFPESIQPIPPIYAWLDLHHYINTMARKMGRQADREKVILAYDGVAEEDAKGVVEADDGQSLRVDNVDRLKEIKFGGINDQSYQYISWLKNNWSEQAGNADLLGGLRQQASTLGQEQMMQANATVGVEDMVNQVHLFTSSILKKMAWHIWTDPLIDVTVSKRIPGTANLEATFSPEAREGDFLDYNIDVEPYSMQRMNPSIRMQKIMQLVTGVIMPLMPMAMQQGVIVEVRSLVKSLARDLDLTDAEVDEWFKTMVPVQQDMGPYQPQQGQVKPKSGQSDDRFGASESSREMNMGQQQNRAGGQPSPAQKGEGR